MDNDEWVECEYSCKDCGGDDVVCNITNQWKLYYCNDCESSTPLSVQDMVTEAQK